MSELCSVLRTASPKRVGPRESMLLGSKLTRVSNLIDSREISVKRHYETRTSDQLNKMQLRYQTGEH
ncbi:hypothetical protein NC651_033345 [Populus alba x Populus x berolinensis]|nr:hypothetical protein NC651_033345 [Populus alba x Populus x berolinensis]